MRMHQRIPQATSTPTERRLAREARSAQMRGQALALRRDGATYAAIGVALGVSLERARRIVIKGERLADYPHWFDSLPARAVNFLINNGLDSLSETAAARAVALRSRHELMTNPNFGRGACGALCAWLSAHGLALREIPPTSADCVVRNHTKKKPGRVRTRAGLERLSNATPQSHEARRRASG
jgi:hypothetical protein